MTPVPAASITSWDDEADGRVVGNTARQYGTDVAIASLRGLPGDRPLRAAHALSAGQHRLPDHRRDAQEEAIA
ncbi:MAG: hypothetical protein P4L48_01755 [Mycobacterium sp.]|nr:hypothetical protein [Mycobacterium sp.]HKI42447.1 hypothetical protein [Mycobacterium sp.]